ncbi:M16 family metallopeptidase [Streptomyces sp. NPDC058848]|uniref:M16 family metallopeptidase n=1 Tax=unclassified Streptomyces TaxID=2593676 RepID=UPI00369F3C4D
MTVPLTVEEVPGRGLVAVALTVRAGGDDDPPGRHGTAHLVEHLMFPRGAGDDSGHVALVEEAGGMCNAETHRDHTVFHTVAPADALPGILALEARRLRRFAPAPATVRSENAVVAEEIRAADAGTRLWDTVLAAVHPGARDAYGTVAELREVTAAQAAAFFRRHYRPERAVLTVVGDVDAGRTAELVAREFDGWAPPPDAAPDPAGHPAPVPSARGDGATARPEAPVPYHRDGVAIGHALADPRRDQGTYFAQAVLCEVLRRSRLPGLLTRSAGVDAATVRCGYQGQWLASAAPDLALVLLGRAPGTGTDEAVALWRDTLGELAAAPPAEEELRPAVAVLRAACHRQADSLAARAVTHGRGALLFPGVDGTGPDTIPGRLAAVTATEVSAAARALLTAPSTVRTLERATERATESATERATP